MLPNEAVKSFHIRTVTTVAHFTRTSSDFHWIFRQTLWHAGTTMHSARQSSKSWNKSTTVHDPPSSVINIHLNVISQVPSHCSNNSTSFWQCKTLCFSVLSACPSHHNLPYFSTVNNTRRPKIQASSSSLCNMAHCTIMYNFHMKHNTLTDWFL